MLPSPVSLVFTGEPSTERVHKMGMEPNGERWGHYEVPADALTTNGTYTATIIHPDGCQIQQDIIVPDPEMIDSIYISCGETLEQRTIRKKTKIIIIEFQLNDMYLNYNPKKIDDFLINNNFTLVTALKFPFMLYEDRIYINKKY
mgnify:CR=1 FL=1